MGESQGDEGRIGADPFNSHEREDGDWLIDKRKPPGERNPSGLHESFLESPSCVPAVQAAIDFHPARETTGKPQH